MPEHVNENKTKAELLVEINNLKKQLSDNNDFLTEIGIFQKETFMTRIEALEENTLKKIEKLITNCESETGRDFPWIVIDHKEFKNMRNYDMAFAHKVNYGMSAEMYKDKYHSNQD